MWYPRTKEIFKETIGGILKELEGKRDFMFLHGTLFDNKFDIDVSVQEKGEETDTHYHDYIEIVCQLSGNSTHFVDEKEIILEKNQILIINLDQSHRNLPSNYEIINIILPKQYLDTLIMESSYDDTVLYLRKFLVGHKIIATYELNSESAEKIKKIWDLHANSETARMYHFKIKLELIQFLIGLNYLFEIVEEVEGNDLDIVSYINNNLQTACLNDFAKSLNYSASTVSQQISDKYHQSFIDLLHLARLNKAAQLLLTSDYKISYVMREIGYNNKTFFYSIFKQKYNMTPNQYRIKYKKRESI